MLRRRRRSRRDRRPSRRPAFDAIGVDLASVDAHVAGVPARARRADVLATCSCWCPASTRPRARPAPSVRSPRRSPRPCASPPWAAGALDELARRSAICADVLADHGCRLAVEFTPYTPLTTLAAGRSSCATPSAGTEPASCSTRCTSSAPVRRGPTLAGALRRADRWSCSGSDAPAVAPAQLDSSTRAATERLLPGVGRARRSASSRAAVVPSGYDGLVSAEVLSRASCAEPSPRPGIAAHVRGACRARRWVAQRASWLNGMPLVGARLGREAEHPLADDVALDLVGAAGDAVAGCAEHVLGPRVGAPLPRIGDEARPEDARPRRRTPRSSTASTGASPSSAAGPGAHPASIGRRRARR